MIRVPEAAAKNTKNAAEKLRNNPLVSCTECMNDHAFRQR